VYTIKVTFAGVPVTVTGMARFLPSKLYMMFDGVVSLRGWGEKFAPKAAVTDATSMTTRKTMKIFFTMLPPLMKFPDELLDFEKKRSLHFSMYASFQKNYSTVM